jgi:GT2 family glycosyltransferase
MKYPRVSIVTSELQPGSANVCAARITSESDLSGRRSDCGRQWFATEDATEVITPGYPDVKFMRSEKNLGFAGGNNLGFSASTGKYLMFLNNDTEVDRGFIEPLVSFFEANPKAGAASSKIFYHNSGDIIQYAGSTSINPFTGRNKRLGFMEKDCGQHDTLRETTELAHGAAMMVPRSVIERQEQCPNFSFCTTRRSTGVRA